MSKKRTKRFKALILIMLVVVLALYGAIKLYSYGSTNETTTLTKNNNEITYTLGESRRFIHIKLNAYSVNYKIINPKGEIVKSGQVDGSDEYFGAGTKGEWKIVFDIDEDKGIDYTIWEGNLKSKDDI